LTVTRVRSSRGPEAAYLQASLHPSYAGEATKDSLVAVSIPTLIVTKENAVDTGHSGPRVSFFMNRFRKLGFIDYHGGDALQVHSSLLNVVLHD
jgi:hypothetical protein